MIDIVFLKKGLPLPSVMVVKFVSLCVILKVINPTLVVIQQIFFIVVIIAVSEGKLLSSLFSGLSSNNGCNTGSLLQMPSKLSLGMLCRPSGLWSGGLMNSLMTGGWHSGYNAYPQYGNYMGRLW